MAIRIRIPAVILRVASAVSSLTVDLLVAVGEVIRSPVSIVGLAAVSSGLGGVVVLAVLAGRPEAAMAVGASLAAFALLCEAGRYTLSRRDAAPDVAAMAKQVSGLARARADLDRREAEVAAREREVSVRVAMLLAAEATLAAREHSRRAKTPPRGARRPAGLPIPLAPVRADDVLRGRE